jgi:hypothetical protein
MPAKSWESPTRKAFPEPLYRVRVGVVEALTGPPQVPVRVDLEEVPEEVELRVGTTASVLFMTGEDDSKQVPPTPQALQ